MAWSLEAPWCLRLKLLRACWLGVGRACWELGVGRDGMQRSNGMQQWRSCRACLTQMEACRPCSSCSLCIRWRTGTQTRQTHTDASQQCSRGHAERLRLRLLLPLSLTIARRCARTKRPHAGLRSYAYARIHAHTYTHAHAQSASIFGAYPSVAHIEVSVCVAAVWRWHVAVAGVALA